MERFIIHALFIHRKVSSARLASRGDDSVCVGDLVALHRKVHLFDIDIPGKITFKVFKGLSITTH